MSDNFYKQLMEQSPTGYAYHKIILDENNRPCDYEFIEVNNAFEELTGLMASDILGKTVSEVLPDIKRSEFNWIDFYGEVAMTLEEKEFEQFSEPLKRWYKVKVYSPEKYYFITSFMDVTNEHVQINDLKTLSAVSETFLEWIDAKIDYLKITERILELSGSKFAAFNLYDEDGRQYTTMAIAGDRGILNKTMDFMGIKLDGKKWDHDPVRAEKIKDKIVTRFSTLHDLAGEVIPKPVYDLVTMSFGIGEIVLVKITKRGIMLGDFTLIMPKGKLFNKEKVIEIIAKQLGLMIGRKRVEEKLKESEKRFRTVVQNIDAGVIIYSPEGSIVSCNERASELLGLSIEQLKGKVDIDPKWKFVNEDGSPLPQENHPVEQILRERKPIKDKLIGILRATDKNIGWVLVNGTLTLNTAGEISEVIISFTDFTERKQNEDELNRFKVISDNAVYGKAIADLDGKLIYVNNFFAEIHGYTPDELLGKHVSVFHNPEQLEAVDQIIAHMLTSGNFKPQEVWHINRNGTVFPMMMSGVVIKDQKNRPQYIASSAIDITEQKIHELKLRESEEQYRLLTTQMQMGLALHEIICDNQGNPVDYRFINVNDSYERITGLKRVDVIGRTVLDVLPNTEKYWIESFGEVALTGKATQYENYSAEIGRYYSTVIYSPKKGQFAVIVEDITERKEMEKQILKEKEQFKTTLLSVGDGVISVDTNGKVLIMNKISENLTGWTQEEAFGKPMEEVFNIINEFTRERCENPVKKVLATGNIIELANHTILISKDGIERPIEDSAAPIKDEQGNIFGVVLVFRDFTEKKEKQEQIEFLSYNDQLTGLYNRRHYEKEIIRIDNEKYFPLTLIMADVNGLKLTNDAFGHMKGDLLLKKISRILKNECRKNDIVSRIGGDEFALLLPNTDKEHAEKIINRINEAIENEKVDNVILSISLGYAVKHDSSEHIDEVFSKAEDAMYRHKLAESSSMRSKTIDLIMNTLFEKNSRENFHNERVGDISRAIAGRMNFTKNELNEIAVAGRMHDVGKIGISETNLNKRDRLNANECEEVKKHPEIGYRILSSVNEFSQIAKFVLEHHEKWDGTGYPKGLKQDAISLQARIVAVADAYDAMTKKRTYRKTLTEDEAISEIIRCSGAHFDPDVVKIFVEDVYPEIRAEKTGRSYG